MTKAHAPHEAPHHAHAYDSKVAEWAVLLGSMAGVLMQALDMYPPAKRGSVMAIWGMGVMLGPILGPTLGGVLTDAYSWRWVFYINVPFGLAACAALWFFFKDTAKDKSLKFDWFGFGALSV